MMDAHRRVPRACRVPRRAACTDCRTRPHTQGINNGFKKDGACNNYSTIAGGGGTIKVVSDYLHKKSKQDVEFATTPHIETNDWREVRKPATIVSYRIVSCTTISTISTIMTITTITTMTTIAMALSLSFSLFVRVAE